MKASLKIAIEVIVGVLCLSTIATPGLSQHQPSHSSHSELSKIMQSPSFHEGIRRLPKTESPWNQMYQWFVNSLNNPDFQHRTRERFQQVDIDFDNSKQALDRYDQDFMQTFSKELTRNSLFISQMKSGLSFNLSLEPVMQWFKSSPTTTPSNEAEDPIQYGLELQEFVVERERKGLTDEYRVVPIWKVVEKEKHEPQYTVRPYSSSKDATQWQWTQLANFRTKMTPSESLLNSPKAQFSLKLELQQVNDYYRLEIPSFLGDSQDESQMRHHLMLPIVDRCRLRHQFDGDHDPIDSMAEWTLNQEQLFRLIFQHQDHSFGSEWILDNHHNHLISVKSIFTQDQIENDSLLKTLPQGNYQLSLIRSL